MNKSTKQQELADKIARLKASKGKSVSAQAKEDANVKNSKIVNTSVKKPAPVKSMKPMKNMSSGRKG